MLEVLGGLGLLGGGGGCCNLKLLERFLGLELLLEKKEKKGGGGGCCNLKLLGGGEGCNLKLPEVFFLGGG